MKTILVEWKHRVNLQSKNLRAAIDNDDYEGIKLNAIAVLEKAKTFFNEDEEDYILSEIDDLIEEFNDLSTDESDYEDYVDYDNDDYDAPSDAEEAMEQQFNYALSQLYDFCDGYGIWLDI